MEKARSYKASGKYAIAKEYLEEARSVAPNEVYVVQQLALVTYKSKQPTEREALTDACDILETLNPLHSNNAETLGLWGAIHKRLYTITQDKAMLDKAVYAYEKGYRLLSDYYNGINWAYLLNVRAAACGDRGEAVADFVLARRARADVLAICEAKLSLLKDSQENRSERYWLLATAAEAACGLGDETRCSALLDQAKPYADEAFMLPSTTDQLNALRGYLAASPLRWVSDA
jgi:tetratricopeptide (TPR) repeat protein